MLFTILAIITAIIIGMIISITVFGTGGKKKKVFQDIYFSLEDVNGIGIIYTKTGEYSAVLKMENPVQKYSADVDSYYDAAHFFNNLALMLGDGYAVHKQDIFSKRKFINKDKNELGYLSKTYFTHFEGREYVQSQAYLIITQTSGKSKLFSYDSKKWDDFILKIHKVFDLFKDANIKASFLTAKECRAYADRFFAMNFSDDIVSMDNFKVDDEMLLQGDRRIKVYSLVDIDSCGLPGYIRPYTNIEVNNTLMPQDFMSEVSNIPNTDTIIYNQMIFSASQKRELSSLEKKKNRHASMHSPSNQIAVEDIKKVQELIARDSKLLVYAHFNIIVSAGKTTDLQACTNHIENMFSRVGINISKRSYNQLELFVSSFPGNCFSLSKEYDRFLTLSEAATCLFYSECVVENEETPLKMYYTDRQGIPVCIDITGKEGKNRLTDNSNFFCLGPSGSGKSFHMNSMVRQLHEQGTDIVMVDTGDSYEGLCAYLGGKYISYTKEKPITMNPFKIRLKEMNIEKVNFLKNLILQIWKGSFGTVTKMEDMLISQLIKEYYEDYFNGGKCVELSFNSFYEFSIERVPEIIRENNLSGINFSDFKYLLKDFYKGGSHEATLNENMDTSLFDETFIVFEVDAIKDDAILFPIVTLIIMDVFLQKMRKKKNRKALIIEEAWKAIATPLMAEYIKYMYKTARKFWGIVGIVTQELQDILGSQIVKEAIINNSDIMMLLDQSKFKERFKDIKEILGLTAVDCRKIFTINRLENKEGRAFFREIFIRRGQKSAVYGVEESKECYITYTTERQEKDALKLYKAKLGPCSHKDAVIKYCKDWRASKIPSSMAFAREVSEKGDLYFK